MAYFVLGELTWSLMGQKASSRGVGVNMVTRRREAVGICWETQAVWGTVLYGLQDAAWLLVEEDVLPVYSQRITFVPPQFFFRNIQPLKNKNNKNKIKIKQNKQTTDITMHQNVSYIEFRQGFFSCGNLFLVISGALPALFSWSDSNRDIG